MRHGDSVTKHRHQTWLWTIIIITFLDTLQIPKSPFLLDNSILSNLFWLFFGASIQTWGLRGTQLLWSSPNPSTNWALHINSYSVPGIWFQSTETKWICRFSRTSLLRPAGRTISNPLNPIFSFQPPSLLSSSLCSPQLEICYLWFALVHLEKKHLHWYKNRLFIQQRWRWK